MISFTTDVWYAHSVVSSENRMNFDSALLGATNYGSADISPSSFSNRSSPWSVTEDDLSVVAGEQLVVQIEKASGQTFGSLNGVEISGTFTAAGAIPEPSTWALMVVGFAGLGYAGFKRSRKAQLA
jgi:PEP-CTERM motif